MQANVYQHQNVQNMPVNKINPPKTANKLHLVSPGVPVTAGSFAEILSRKTEEKEQLQFSKHAEQRLKSRDITLTDNQMQRAETGVLKAKQKGIKDSLVLVDGVALVINTKSNVVITALESAMDSVFTNIDGAVIV
jgi:flagellar operon protein